MIQFCGGCQPLRGCFFGILYVLGILRSLPGRAALGDCCSSASQRHQQDQSRKKSNRPPEPQRIIFAIPFSHSIPLSGSRELLTSTISTLVVTRRSADAATQSLGAARKPYNMS